MKNQPIDKTYDQMLLELSRAILPGSAGWTWEDLAIWTVNVTSYFIRRNKLLEEKLQIENPGDYEKLIKEINDLVLQRSER